ncbi:NUDIX hydrolase [Aegicerativicinus sediminis]|uniref:NUDIX hydrolase n=1 Tax=Aegicerativicinus sediminis TaxID=2893202 RepID=UPI001E31A597|nr:NUDIX domain-containing protein [Aegicerativicinus sediminis]
MEDELIDITDENGNPLGKAVPKSEIHKNGLYHHTAHLWLYTHDKNILLQQRAASKSICPLMWDVSVAGHVDAGETVEHAAARECFEELGLKVNTSDFEKVGIFPCFQTYDNGIKDFEFHNTFICQFEDPISELQIDPIEVENIKLVNFIEFEHLLEHSGNNNHFVPSNRKYYETVLQSIRNKFN